jgi:hypothetical protein
MMAVAVAAAKGVAVAVAAAEAVVVEAILMAVVALANMVSELLYLEKIRVRGL